MTLHAEPRWLGHAQILHGYGTLCGVLSLIPRLGALPHQFRQQ